MEENQGQAPVGAPVQSENVGFPGSMQSTPNKKSNKLVFIIIIIFLLFIGAITFLVFKSSRSTGEEVPIATTGGSVEATPSSTSSPTPTPAAIKKSDVKIQILNGTGIAGEAGLLQTQLNNLGYTKVDVGNASDTSATSTTVVFSSTLPSVVVSEITTKLKAMYVSVDSTTSSTISTYDVKITTGSRKGQSTTTPSASPSASPKSST